MVFSITFNNISWRSVLLEAETGENHRPVASHWHTLSHNVVSSTRRHELFIVMQLHFKLEFIVTPSKAEMIKIIYLEQLNVWWGCRTQFFKTAHLLKTITAKFGLIWFSDFLTENFNVICIKIFLIYIYSTVYRIYLHYTIFLLKM
jgi:hypothetical protein